MFLRLESGVHPKVSQNDTWIRGITDSEFLLKRGGSTSGFRLRSKVAAQPFFSQLTIHGTPN
jgi:hypothetical protein